MPPRKVSDLPKRAASPAPEDTIRKRLRSSTTRHDVAAEPPVSTGISKLRPKPPMRPKRPLSPGDEPLPSSVAGKPKKLATKSGLKLATVGMAARAKATGKGKAKAVVHFDEGSEYGKTKLKLKKKLMSSKTMLTMRSKYLAKSNLQKHHYLSQCIDKKPGEPSPEIEANTPSEPSLRMAKLVFVAQKGSVLSRPVEIEPTINFATFELHVAKAFGAVAGQQELMWKTDRMAKADKNWRELSNDDDLRIVIAIGVSTLEDELKRAQVVVARNEEGEKKALLKGKPFFPKAVPTLADFTIIVRDLSYENKAKVSKKETKSSKKEATAGPLAGIAEKILRCAAAIKERKCAVCGKSCVVIPQENAPAIHKPLTEADIQTWAQSAAKQGDTSFESVPKALMLQFMDRKGEPRGKKNGPSGSTPPNNNPPSTAEPPVPPLAPAQPHPGHPHPPPYGHYPPYPPYPPYGYPFPPPPADYNYGGYGGPPRVTGRTLISEWLPMCDRGQRGENNDNFSALIAGFSLNGFYYLSDIQHKDANFFTQIDFPTVPGAPTFRIGPATASRLHRYLAHDLS
ncbi:hypothetical protein RhiJN_27024 [Ceratobasidium sp. AG-Ba]|nr:hypothetical protein RhiJN_27024 [Ceratobasidium sp. AG-Ba]